MGAVINSSPNTQLLAVSILNDLSTNSPGTTSTLRAEITIGQPVATALSTFLFTLHAPFSFSAGSIPSTIESASYASTPIPLYASVVISSFKVVSPNLFLLTFN